MKPCPSCSAPCYPPDDYRGTVECAKCHHVFFVPAPPSTPTLHAVNQAVKALPDNERGKVSDGYHTFDELYEHRCLLWIFALDCLDSGLNVFGERKTGDVWRSKKHGDGTEWEGWFLLGSCTEQGKQMTYHLPIKYGNYILI